MNNDDLARAYNGFFKQSEAGAQFMEELHRLRTDYHKAAEANPEQARDLVQSAKGIGQVLTHITSVIGSAQVTDQ